MESLNRAAMTTYPYPMPHKLSDSAFVASQPSDPSTATGQSDVQRAYVYRTQDPWYALSARTCPPDSDTMYAANLEGWCNAHVLVVQCPCYVGREMYLVAIYAGHSLHFFGCWRLAKCGVVWLFS